MGSFIDCIVCQLHSMNPQTDGENAVIRYSLELVIENIIKVAGILILGLFIGKARDFLVALFIFGSVRSQAGGIHAKTNWGCMFCMMGICIITSAARIVAMSNMCLMTTYVSAILIILLFAPKTINDELFTNDIKNRKRIAGIILVSIYTLLALLNENARTLIMVPILLEIFTLLPIKEGGIK